METAVRDLRKAVGSFLAGFDVAVLTGEQAARAVGEFSCIEKMAATGRMLAATRVAETTAWEGEGDKSPADWLARKSGSSVGEAAGILGTGKKTKKLPKTRRAMRKGKLSAAQAKAVGDGADATGRSTCISGVQRLTVPGCWRCGSRCRSKASVTPAAWAPPTRSTTGPTTRSST